MNSELVAVIGTIFGVLVGGFINYLATRSVKKHEWSLALAKEIATSRQKLYSEFLVEAQRLVIQANENKISSLSDLNFLNGKFAEISLVASSSVIEVAKTLADAAITSHSAQQAKEVKSFFELKKAFISEVRKEIENVLGKA